MDNEKRYLKIDDMDKIEYISYLSVSKNQEDCVYVKYIADKESGEFISHLYEIDQNTKKENMIVNLGDSSESKPAFSPDGSKLAFLSNKSGEKQVWIKDLKSNDIKQLTRVKHGIENFSFSPDGKNILIQTKLWTYETEEDIQVEMTIEEREQWQWEKENMPIVVEELMYKFDEDYGMFDGGYRHIGVVSSEGGHVKMITSGDKHYDSASWSPNNEDIVFYGYPYNHNKAKSNEVFIGNINTGNIKQITHEKLYMSDSNPIFNKDGDKIIYGKLASEDQMGAVIKLFEIDLNNNEERGLFPAKELCHGIVLTVCGKTVIEDNNLKIQISECGNYVYFLSSWQGYTHVYQLDLKNRNLKQVTKGKISVSSFLTPIKNQLYYTAGDTTTIDEVYKMDLKTQDVTRITHLNNWMQNIYMREPKELWVKTIDGKYDIHGYFIPPVELDESKSYGAVLDIHGGPVINYTAGWWHEFQMISANNLAVIYCDPRGSTGYGYDYANGQSAWGKDAFDDLITFVDAVLEKYPYIDKNKIGVTGGSYGGYMTNKLISRSDKFKAAVTQRTFCNQATSYGTGDMGFISNEKNPPSFYKYMMNRAKESLIAEIDNVKIPLLILHGYKDYRCSFEQGEQVFVALKDRKPELPVKMVVFPEENHGVTRTGKLYSQKKHLEELVNWFVKYLNEEISNGGEDCE